MCVVGRRGRRLVSFTIINISKPFDEQFFLFSSSLHLQSSSSNLLPPLHPVVSSTSRLPISSWVYHPPRINLSCPNHQLTYPTVNSLHQPVATEELRGMEQTQTQRRISPILIDDRLILFCNGSLCMGWQWRFARLPQ